MVVPRTHGCRALLCMLPESTKLVAPSWVSLLRNKKNSMILWLVFLFSKIPSTIAMNHWLSHGTVCIFCAHPSGNRGALRETERSAVTEQHPRPHSHSPTSLCCCVCSSVHIPNTYRRHLPCPEPGQAPGSKERGISKGQSFPPVSLLQPGGRGSLRS